MLFNPDVIQRLESSDDITKFQIYFLTVTKKIRFDLKRSSIGATGLLKTWVTIGRDQSTRLVVRLSQCSGLVRQLSVNPISCPIKRFWLDYGASDERMLSVKLELDDATAVTLGITPENILSSATVEKAIPQSIVYVGQSFQMIRRLQSHKKINELSSTLHDDEELAIHLVHFQIGYGGGQYMDESWQFFFEQNSFGAAEHRAKITLLERLLIAFFLPELNDMHTRTPLHTDPQVQRVLAKRGIYALALGIGMRGGPLWQYSSKKQQMSSEIVSYNIAEPESGFHSGLAALDS
jgi:hypothetical protein